MSKIFINRKTSSIISFVWQSLYGRVRMVLVIMTLIMLVVLMMMSAVVVMEMLVLENYFAVQVPRRQGEDSNGCLHCALNVSLAALSDYKGRPRWQMMVKIRFRCQT